MKIWWRGLSVAALGLACAAKAPAAAPMQFMTMAGLAGNSGSANGTGSVARFNYPQSVTVGATGTVYVADALNHVIRQITPTGAVTTLAGLAGVAGSLDATGAGARFNMPGGVAVDGAGNVFVADTGNHTIRKITPAGVVTTVAGAAGVFGSTDGTGTVARFRLPYALAVDGFGNLFVADTGNHTIRQITPGGTVSTLAGSAGILGSADGTGPAAQFYQPCGIAVDARGNIFVADTFNHTIRTIAAGGVVTTLAGLAGSAGSSDRVGGEARFNQPYGVAADPAGCVYVADTGNHTLRTIDPAGGVSTVGGLAGSPGDSDGEAGAARFHSPGGLAANSAGQIVLADTFNHTVRQGRIIQTTDVEVIDFAIQWPAGNLLGQSPTHISLTLQNNGPDDLTTNTFTLEINLRNPDEWFTLGTYAFPLALPAGDSATLSIPPASVVLPDKYWMGNWPILVALRPSNSALIGSHFYRSLPTTNSIRIPGFIIEGAPTLNGQVTDHLAVPTGTSVSGGFIARLQNGQDSAAFMTTLIGFVNSSNQWVGGDPQVIYTEAPPTNSTLRTVTWPALASPATPGVYALRYKTYLTWQIPWCLSQFKSNPPTHSDLGGSYFMEGLVGTVSVLQPTDLQAVGLNLTLPQGDPRGQYPAALSVSLKNNGPGVWDAKSCLVEAYLAAQDAPTNAWLRLGEASVSPSIAVGQTVTNALGFPELLGFKLPIQMAGGLYTTWLHITPQNTAPLDTNTNNNWVAGNTVLIPNYSPSGMFSFTTWLGKLWTLGNTDGLGGQARFYSPYSVAADNIGNYYIADALNHTIRKATKAGVVTTLAGSPGSRGSADGYGSSARFNLPMGVAVDGAGNIYVADCYNHTIRKITPAGLVSTLAGMPGQGGLADGVGTAARFAGPYALAVDATGMVYVADTWNHTIRKITPAGVVTTLAGLGQIPGSSDGLGSSARFTTPMGIAVSPNGLLYVTDTGNHTIRVITPDGAVTTLAGLAGVAGSAEGAGSSARFNTPTGIACDRNGFLYVADSGNQTLRGLNLNGVTSTVGGQAGVKGEANGLGTVARFNGPQSLTLDPGGNLIVADTYNDVVRFGALITTATVHVEASPISGGTVSGGGSYTIGTNVTLTALPNAGWTFSMWSDGMAGSNRTVIVPPSDSWYVARFLPTLGVAADAPALTWSTGGASAWFGQLTTSHDNLGAAQSGALSTGQTNWMQATVTNTPGSFLFWWKSSSDPSDALEFYAYTDTQTQAVARIYGNADWQQYAVFLSTTNPYTLKWRYIKNSGSSGAGWVDQVTWIPCPYAQHVPQLFFQNSGGLLASWVLNSTGGFEFARMLANTGTWALKAAGDIDGDGVSDLLFQTPTGDTGGWFMNADGSTRDARFWWNTAGWELKACADYEGVGRAQLFFQTASGTVVYWRLDASGVFQSAVVLGNLGAWKLRGGGDIDGDGKAELFWQNAAGAVAIWYHNPDGSIRGVIPFNTSVWALRGVADVDADGVSDLLWQTPDLRTAGWFMNADGTFRDARFWWPTPGWQLKAAGR